jgi:hypothetical protein
MMSTSLYLRLEEMCSPGPRVKGAISQIIKVMVGHKQRKTHHQYLPAHFTDFYSRCRGIKNKSCLIRFLAEQKRTAVAEWIRLLVVVGGVV